MSKTLVLFGVLLLLFSPCVGQIPRPDTLSVTLNEELVFVKGGSFTMGNSATNKGFKDELPAHKVTLKSFYIGKYEVTQKEYSDYMVRDTSWTSDHGCGPKFPAYHVSWYAVLKYCNLRSLYEKLNPCYTINGSTNPADWGPIPTTNDTTWNAVICNWSANGYRLPTEAEWEYAARGGTNDPDYLYSGSDDINLVAWYGDNASDASHPVGNRKPNGIGTYDMSGNLYEWCWDWYSNSYYSSSPNNNPTGPVNGSSRVVRGGDWRVSAYHCRVANRFEFAPYCNNGCFGFRVCRSAN
jgi:formylglycine-generating enzyme required for sulfatase activity